MHHRRSTERFRDDVSHGARERLVHRDANARISRFPLDADDPGMGEPSRQVGVVADDEVSLRAEMAFHRFADRVRLLIGNQPDVDGGARFGGNRVCRLFADAAGRMPRAPYTTSMRRLWCTGPSQKIQASASSRSRLRSSDWRRCVDSASSSPSK